MSLIKTIDISSETKSSHLIFSSVKVIKGFLAEAFLINSHYEEYFQVQTPQAEEMEKPAKVGCSESIQNIIVYKQILQLN